MLTIRAMANGSGYSKNHLERNDYYAEGERVNGFWFGRGAAKLGLSGPVQQEQFEAVRQGLHPETGDKLRQRKSADRTARDGSKQSEGRNLYDFTFSAPKSVSIMAGPGGDARLIEAHDRAVKEALTELERCAATRVRAKGQTGDRTTGNLIVACYRHDASRELDPQLHTHAVAANMTYDADEKRWKALQAGAIFERRALLTEVYRNSLAREVQALGYRVKNRAPAKGRDLGFEIEGVSRDLMEKFSQRSKQRDKAIDTFIERTGRAPTDSEIAVLVRGSRPAKLAHISTHEVKERQQARLSGEERIELAALRDASVGHRDKNPQWRDAEISLQYAIDHFFERVSVAHDFDVKAEALRHGRGHLTLEEIDRALIAREAKGDLIRAGDEIATRQSLDRERRMIARVNEGQARFDRLGGSANDFQLSEQLSAEQKRVVGFVCDSRDFAVNIQGAAGTGKTATLHELGRALQAGERLMLAVAPTKSAVEELQKTGFQNAMTVERLLQDKETHSILAGRALIVDEAGMVSGRQMDELLSLATRFGARLIFSGDTRQIQSVEASDALRILEKESRLATVGLREVRRQQNREYKSAMKTLRSDPAKGFELLDRMGAVKETGLIDRPEAVAAAYRNASGRALVVCPTHAEIGRVTSAIRADRRDRGELGEGRLMDRLEPLNWTEAQKRDLSNFAPGQALVFHKGTKEARKHESLVVARQEGRTLFVRNERGIEIGLTQKQAKCFGVFERRSIEVAVGDRLAIQTNLHEGRSKFTNGELVQVSKISRRGEIELEDGRTLPRGFQQFTHGYAVTAHKSQGKTVDEVIISGDAMTRELFYVAASRGRHRIQVFTGDKEFLRGMVGLSAERQSALELLRRSARQVDRTRQAERPRTLTERIGSLLEKAWQNLPRQIFGERFAPERGERLEIGR